MGEWWDKLSERKKFWITMSGLMLGVLVFTGILLTTIGRRYERTRSSGHYVIKEADRTYKAYDYYFFGEDSGLFGGGSKPHLHLDLCNGAGLTISNARATIKRVSGDCRADGVGRWK